MYFCLILKIVKYNFSKIVLFIILISVLKSCVISKKIGKDEIILKDVKIMIDGNFLKKDSLSPLIVQKENNYIFGLPISALIYESAKKNPDSVFKKWLNKSPKRVQRLNKIFSRKQVSQIGNYVKSFNNWKKRNGDSIEIIDSIKNNISSENLKSFFDNNGYFDSKISSQIERHEKNKKFGKVIYDIKKGNQYYLDSIKSNIESRVLDSIYTSNISETFLKKNAPFNTLNFEKERDRLNELFKNSGFFNFQINSISFEVSRDTTGNDLRIPVLINIAGRNPTNQKNYKPHKISKINLYAEDPESSQENRNFNVYENINIFSSGELRYKPEFLTELVSFKNGDLYSDLDRSKTIKQFNNLDNFKYPSVNYKYLNGSDDNLEANILLSSKKRFSLGFGFDLKHSNIEDIGIAFENSFNSRNVFKGAERLQLSTRGTIGKSANTTISEFGVDLNIRFPRFYLPFVSKKIIPIENEPITYLSIGTSKQTNIGLDRQSFKLNFDYDWVSKKNQYKLGLINIELVNNKNSINYFNIYSNSYDAINSISKKYNTNNSYYNLNNNLTIPQGIDYFINDVISKNLNVSQNDFNRVGYINDRKNRLIANNLIIGSNFSLIKNNRLNIYDQNFSQYKLKVELSGNLIDLLSNPFSLSKNEFGNKKLLGLAYSQFFKSEFNYIKYWSLSPSSTVAFRGFYGIAIPFGNSSNIPFSKSFFAGGSNDNRAWEVYRLGPGSSGATSEFNEANMKIAFNIEYRFKLIGKLDSAIFTDFGNIWNVFDDTTDSKRSFTNFRDLDEIAIGSGFGLRYNLGYFIIRLDMGLKTYNPALEKSERWFTDFNLKKAVFNIGLNYPF